MRMVCTIAALALALGPRATLAQSSSVDQLLSVDREFAAYAAEHGTAAAFRAFMDPTDSREFGGGEPVRGAEAIYQAQGGDKPETAKLAWSPTEAFADKGGDMGVTWGTWRLTPIDPAHKAIGGRYVTVWRKDAEGHWKGLIDIGNPD